MGYFTDCGLLVLLSFLRLFYRLPDAGFLIAFLCTVILVCSTYALGKKCIRIVLGAGMGLLALVIPEMFFFYPCLFYLFFCEKMPLLALGAWALLVCRTMGSWENGLFFAAAGSLGLLFAFFMERNTRKCSSLEEELKRTRDDSRERDLLLSQKNKALLEKQDYEIRLPQLEEYSKEIKLGFEKEVLGIYLTGHPLEEYEERWRKNISAVTTDFVLDEETNEVKVKDNQKVTVGGMITEKTIKYTKNNKVMAFLTLEDLVGTVEVIVFPNSYEKYSSLLNEDEKVFITGRANVEEDKNGKIICEQITSFDSVKRELWLQFSTKEEFEAKEQELYGKLHDSDGRDSVVIYISSIKAMKRLPNNYNICINQEIVNNLTNFLGENNVKVVEKSIEKRA